METRYLVIAGGETIATLTGANGVWTLCDRINKRTERFRTFEDAELEIWALSGGPYGDGYTLKHYVPFEALSDMLLDYRY